MDKEKIIINVMGNSPNILSLFKILLLEYNMEYLLVSWYIMENMWYIPMEYNSLSKEKYFYEQYITGEPKSINIQKTKKIKLGSADIKIIIIYIGDTINSNTYLSLIEFFITKLSISDILRRQKYSQELTLNNITTSIKYPLNDILKNINTISLPEEYNAQLEKLNKSAISLANILFDLIDLKNLELKKLKLINTTFNIRQLIKEIMDFYISSNTNSSLTINYYIDKATPVNVFTDKKRVKQILINLIENALLNTEKGEISLFVSSTVVYLENEIFELNIPLFQNYRYIMNFIIVDTGNGINDSFKNLIFRQLEITNDGKKPNLNMRLSYLLSRRLGGDLRLLHSELGKGSCFNFELSVDSEEIQDFNTITLKNLKNKTLLLIDNSTDRDILVNTLNNYELVYDIASSFEEILLLYNNKKYDIVTINVCSDINKLEELIIWGKKNWEKSIFISVGNKNLINEKSITNDKFDLSINDNISEMVYKQYLLVAINMTKNIQGKNPTPILIINDNKFESIMLERLLKIYGYMSITIIDDLSKFIKIIDNYNDEIMIMYLDFLSSDNDKLKNIGKSLMDGKISKIIGIISGKIENTCNFVNIFIKKPINIKELDKCINNLS